MVGICDGGHVIVALACPGALYGLVKLLVWWIRRNINIERVKPGRPELASG